MTVGGNKHKKILEYSVGVISYMERLLRYAAADLDVFADVDETKAYYVEMAAHRDLDAMEADD